MANNTRALKHMNNAQELEDKLNFIKRLTGALRGFVLEAISSARIVAFDTIGATNNIGDLEVRAQYHRANRDVTLELRRGGQMLFADHQFDLKTARLVYNNLDVLIGLAESICEDAGRLEHFNTMWARFED